MYLRFEICTLLTVQLSVSGEEIESQDYPCTPHITTLGNYTTLIANFTFVRRLSSHIFNMYIPSALVVVLSLLTFWIDVGSVPARVALGVTSLLTLSTQASEARKHLPPVDYLTALDVWLFVCILTVFATLVEFAAVYHSYYKQKFRETSVSGNQVTDKAWELPASASERTQNDSHLIQRKVIPDNFGHQQDMPNKNKSEEHRPKEQFLDKVSRILFPVTFLTFSIFYWAYYLY